MSSEEASLKSTSESRRQKLFVGGLCRETSDETLKAYFSKYGELSDSVVIRDMNTKESRGFGYVTFDDYRITKTVLKDKRCNGPHRIDDKEVEVKRAIPRDDDTRVSKTKTCKVFIGGIPDGATEEDIKDSVENALEAEIVKVDLIKKKNEQGEAVGHRGFCFVQVDNDDDTDELCCIKKVEIKGKMVDMKKAEPRGTEGGGGGGGRPRGGRGGGGGYQSRGRGSYGNSGGFSGGGGGGAYSSGYDYSGGGYDQQYGGYSGGGGGYAAYGSGGGGSNYYDSYGGEMGMYGQSSYYPPSGGGGGSRGGRGGRRYQPY